MDEQEPKEEVDTGIPCGEPGCEECAKRENEEKMAADMNLAILIALTPVMVFTLINFTGLV